MSIRDTQNKAAKEHGQGNSAFFQFQDGKTSRFRVLTSVEDDTAILAQHFLGKGTRPAICYGEVNGCPFHTDDEQKTSIRTVCYVLDRADNKVKLAELPYSVVSALGDFQEDDEYSFTTYPMSYDIKVTYDKSAKDKKNIYKTIAGVARDVLSQEVMTQLDEKLNKYPVEEFVAKKKENQMKDHKERGIWVTDEQRAEIAEKRKAGFDEAMNKLPKATSPKVGNSDIEYPEEEINAEDIPF